MTAAAPPAICPLGVDHRCAIDRHFQRRLAAGLLTWRLVSTRAPDGSRVVSIMKTADTRRSDLDFAGLMVRCSAHRKIDVLVVILNPFPPRSRPLVSVSAGANSRMFEGKMAAGGLAIVLPDGAAELAGGPWQTAPFLALTIKQNNQEIKGIVTPDGLGAAYGNLIDQCLP